MDNIFWEVHSDLPQEGPGSDGSTFKALSYIFGQLPNNPKILDIGCGPGRQTLAIARELDCHITAVDNHQPFLDDLNRKIEEEGLGERITTVKASMSDLPFEENSFDLIWSEGAIFIIGFKEGFEYWKKFLKRGGFIAVSEAAWIKENRPDEVEAFWNEAYPEIAEIETHLGMIKEIGYEQIGYFIEPASDWEDYYAPMREKLKVLHEKYKDDSDALSRLDEEEKEIKIFEKYSDYYSYVFYISRNL